MQTIKRMFVAVALLASEVGFGATETVNGITWTYTVANGKASVGGGSSSSPAVSTSTTGAITIPTTLGGKPVTSIGYRAFYNCSGLTSVTIPGSVTSIGDDAFLNCSGLTSVTIPDSVTSIGHVAFYGCNGLKDVVIPGSVTNVGDSAFCCKGLSSITIGNGVESIGEYAFNEYFNPYYPLSQNNAPTNLVNVILCCTNLQELGRMAFPFEYGLCHYDEHGTSIPNNSDCVYTFLAPEEPIASLPMIRRRGASFTGWWTAKDGGEKLVNAADATPGQTYYAHWADVEIANVELAIPDTVTVWDEDHQKITVSDYNVVQPDFISAVYDRYGNLIDAWEDYCMIEIYYSWDTEISFQFDAYSGLRSLPGGDYIVKVSGDGVYCTGAATVPLTVERWYYYGDWHDSNGQIDFSQWLITVGDSTFTPNYASYYDSSFYHDGTVIDLGAYSTGASDRNTVRVYLDESFVQYYGQNYDTYRCYVLADLRAYRYGPVADYWNDDHLSYENYDSSIGRMPIVNAGDYQLTVGVYGYIEEDDAYHYYHVDLGGERTFSIRLSPACFTNQAVVAENAQCVFTGEGINPTNHGFRISLSDPTTYYMENLIVTNAGTYAVRIGAATTADLGFGSMYYCAPDAETAWVEYPYSISDYDGEHAIFNYTGIVEVAYTVLPRPVAKGQAQIDLRELHCDGTPQTCSIVITNDYTGVTLVEGKDYDIAYANNVFAGVATATVTCKGNYTGSFSLEFEILPLTSIAEVLGLDREWTTGGDAEWLAETNVYAHGGVSCMRSGKIGDDQMSWIETVATNACRVSFDWKCSCEGLVKGRPYDYLAFSVDGAQQEFVCGETDWTCVTNYVTGDGEHHLRWSFLRDEDGSSGEDSVWLANVAVAQAVTLTFAAGGATAGSVPEPVAAYADESVVLPGQGSLARPKHAFLGWSDGVTLYAAGASYPCNGILLLTAQWSANTLSAPVITAPATYEADSATVTITADAGASVYYTLDGSAPDPAQSGTMLYQGPFLVEGSATVKAVAVRDDYFDSEVASTTVTRLPWTFGECLNWPEQIFTTGGDAAWTRVKGVSEDGYALRSGVVTHSQTSRLETVVSGAGTVRFACRVEGEIVKKVVWDGLAFCIDGVQQGDLMGNSAWTTNAFEVAGGGAHTLSWLYVKDADGDGDGEDCAWLDCVTWTPSGVTVDAGGGQTVTVPAAWLSENTQRAATDAAANGRKVWECFLLGIDPERADDDFRITRFWMDGDTPMFEFSHTADGAGNSFVPRIRKLGKAELGGAWQEVPAGGSPAFRFFTVEVELP